MFQVITTFFFWRAIIHLHPFWSPHFRRAFGIIGVMIAIAIAATGAAWSFTSLGDLWPIGVVFALLYAPMLAIPLAATLRLTTILFSKRWRSVLDWAVTQAIAIAFVIVGLGWHSHWDVYLLTAAAALAVFFPQIAFERIYGPLRPRG